jgi:hypothetical protein
MHRICRTTVSVMSSLPSYHPLWHLQHTQLHHTPNLLTRRLHPCHCRRRPFLSDRGGSRTDVIDSSCRETACQWQGRLESARRLYCFRYLVEGSFTEIQHEAVYEDGSKTGHGHDQYTEDLKLSLARPVNETRRTRSYMT